MARPCHSGRTQRTETHGRSPRIPQWESHSGLRLVDCSPCVSSFSPPLHVAVSSYKTFTPSEATMFQIFLPLLGFRFGLFSHWVMVCMLQYAIPARALAAVPRSPCLPPSWMAGLCAIASSFFTLGKGEETAGTSPSDRG